MSLATRVEGVIAPTVEAMGYLLVRVELFGGQPQRLQVMAERADNAPMVIDDCVALSRAISAVLDVDDPIAGGYTLEVSSPGIDRPLTRLSDFERFSGQGARIEMDMPIEGRRRFRGSLLGTDGAMVRLQMDDRDWRLPFDGIRRAKLIPTDELMKESKR